VPVLVGEAGVATTPGGAQTGEPAMSHDASHRAHHKASMYRDLFAGAGVLGEDHIELVERAIAAVAAQSPADALTIQA